MKKPRLSGQNPMLIWMLQSDARAKPMASCRFNALAELFAEGSNAVRRDEIYFPGRPPPGILRPRPVLTLLSYSGNRQKPAPIGACKAILDGSHLCADSVFGF